MNRHTAGDRTPFTYVIRCLTTNQIYYGVRYAKNCHPTDLGTKYFSSSTVLKRRIAAYGASSFKFQIRKVFTSVKMAQLWEHKVLHRINAREHPSFINRQNHLFPVDNRGPKNPAYGLPGTMLGRKQSPEAIAKMKLVCKGERSYLFGKHLPDSTKNKISKKQLGANHHRFSGLYHTPYGTYGSAREAPQNIVKRRQLNNWCRNPDAVIVKHHLKTGYLSETDIGKTFRDVGFWFEPVTS